MKDSVQLSVTGDEGSGKVNLRQMEEQIIVELNKPVKLTCVTLQKPHFSHLQLSLSLKSDLTIRLVSYISR